MYVLIGLYLLTPILSTWLQSASRKSVEFYLLIWFIMLCYPYIKPYVSICTSNEGILYYFTGYVGYYLLGWYLRTYYSNIRTKKYLLVLGILSLLCLIVKGFDKYFHFGIDERNGFCFLSIAVMIMCVFWWFACDWVSDKKNVQDGIRTQSDLVHCKLFLWRLFVTYSIDETMDLESAFY